MDTHNLPPEELDKIVEILHRQGDSSTNKVEFPWDSTPCVKDILCVPESGDSVPTPLPHDTDSSPLSPPDDVSIHIDDNPTSYEDIATLVPPTDSLSQLNISDDSRDKIEPYDSPEKVNVSEPRHESPGNNSGDVDIRDVYPEKRDEFGSRDEVVYRNTRDNDESCNPHRYNEHDAGVRYDVTHDRSSCDINEQEFQKPVDNRDVQYDENMINNERIHDDYNQHTNRIDGNIPDEYPRDQMAGTNEGNIPRENEPRYAVEQPNERKDVSADSRDGNRYIDDSQREFQDRNREHNRSFDHNESAVRNERYEYTNEQAGNISDQNHADIRRDDRNELDNSSVVRDQRLSSGHSDIDSNSPSKDAIYRPGYPNPPPNDKMVYMSQANDMIDSRSHAERMQKPYERRNKKRRPLDYYQRRDAEAAAQQDQQHPPTTADPSIVPYTTSLPYPYAIPGIPMHRIPPFAHHIPGYMPYPPYHMPFIPFPPPPQMPPHMLPPGHMPPMIRVPPNVGDEYKHAPPFNRYPFDHPAQFQDANEGPDLSRNRNNDQPNDNDRSRHENAAEHVNRDKRDSLDNQTHTMNRVNSDNNLTHGDKNVNQTMGDNPCDNAPMNRDMQNCDPNTENTNRLHDGRNIYNRDGLNQDIMNRDEVNRPHIKQENIRPEPNRNDPNHEIIHQHHDIKSEPLNDATNRIDTTDPRHTSPHHTSPHHPSPDPQDFVDHNDNRDRPHHGDYHRNAMDFDGPSHNAQIHDINNRGYYSNNVQNSDVKCDISDRLDNPASEYHDKHYPVDYPSDRVINERANEHLSDPVIEQSNAYINNEYSNEHRNEHSNERINEYSNERANEHSNERINEHIDENMTEHKHEYTNERLNPVSDVPVSDTNIQFMQYSDINYNISSDDNYKSLPPKVEVKTSTDEAYEDEYHDALQSLDNGKSSPSTTVIEPAHVKPVKTNQNADSHFNLHNSDDTFQFLSESTLDINLDSYEDDNLTNESNTHNLTNVTENLTIVSNIISKDCVFAKVGLSTESKRNSVSSGETFTDALSSPSDSVTDVETTVAAKTDKIDTDDKVKSDNKVDKTTQNKSDIKSKDVQTKSEPVQEKQPAVNKSNNSNNVAVTKRDSTPTVSKPAYSTTTAKPSTVTAPPQKKSWADMLKTPGTGSASSTPTVSTATTNCVASALPCQPLPVVTAHNVQSVTSEGDAGIIDLGRHIKKVDVKHMYIPLPLKPRGLVNNSNWCYVNATLQALLACTPVYHLLTKLGRLPFLRRAASSTPILDALVRFFLEFGPMSKNDKVTRKGSKQLSITPGQSFSPSYIYSMLQALEGSSSFKSGKQEDAEEFLGLLLNGLHDEMTAAVQSCEETNKAPEPVTNGYMEGEGDDSEAVWEEVGPKNRGTITRQANFSKSPISEIFSGELRSSVSKTGQKDSAVMEPFFTLQLDIQSDKVHSVSDALERLVSKESVMSTKSEEVYKRMTLDQLPPILILHLKFFQYNKAVNGYQKSNKKISYSQFLNITKDVLSPKSKIPQHQRKYELFAVVYHIGKTMAGGHYTAEIYHTGVNSWIRYDDVSINTVSMPSVFSYSPPRVPYLLYYRRCDLPTS